MSQFKKREISITVGQLNNHRQLEDLLGMMRGNSRAELYDSLREYLQNALSMSDKEFNPAVVDFVMNKTSIDHHDQERISEALSCFISVSRELLSLASMYVRGAVGVTVREYRISHIIDYRRDALVLEVIYA